MEEEEEEEKEMEGQEEEGRCVGKSKGLLMTQVSSQCLDHITLFRNSGMRERERQRENLIFAWI